MRPPLPGIVAVAIPTEASSTATAAASSRTRRSHLRVRSMSVSFRGSSSPTRTTLCRDAYDPLTAARRSAAGDGGDGSVPPDALDKTGGGRVEHEDAAVAAEGEVVGVA